MPALQFGKQSIPSSELKADKKAAVKIGPVGMGRRAMYLNSFYISRLYYVLWTDIRRIYKMVAMSKGGFTGIGAFGAMSYLVVELRDGRVKKCQFKYENQTDQALKWIEEHHPEIPSKSAAAQKRLDEKQLRERQSLQPLNTPVSEGAQQDIGMLREAQEYLEKRPELYGRLSSSAGKKRVQSMVPAGRRILASGIFIVSVILIAAGIWLAVHSHPAGIYMLMFGGAFAIFSLAGNLVPIGRNSPRRVVGEWQEAVHSCEEYISAWRPSASFPVPARYAHPVVLERMIRAIKAGRADTSDQALEVVKGDLKKLNRDVKVSQEEYDEVVAVKPMFLVSDYQ